MTLDFTADELHLLAQAVQVAYQECGLNGQEAALLQRLDKAAWEQEEIDNMDLDDCAGGACKL